MDLDRNPETAQREIRLVRSFVMHILIHDYAGHPFQVQLSRALAARGHEVVHAYFGADTGPKGRMSVDGDDPKSLSFASIGEDIAYSKTNFLKRRAGDLEYGKLVAELVAKNSFDIVISGNTPTESQEFIVKACLSKETPFVFWCQDFYSIAASTLLRQKLSIVGSAIGAWYRFVERRQMRHSAHVIHITERFCEQTDQWGIPREKVSVIPNWGAIDEIDVLSRDTVWAEHQGLSKHPRFVYSGTLAMKHNPELLAELARQTSDAEVILTSAGVGAETLRSLVDAGELSSLRVLPLQPFEVFPQVLASADVLLAVIERGAGDFSVPSKILSYLCTGRPIVLAAPKNNLAAQILIETGAGKVVEPEDVQGFVDAVKAFREDPNLSASAGKAGRVYAEENFVLSRVADRFEDLFDEMIDA